MAGAFSSAFSTAFDIGAVGGFQPYWSTRQQYVIGGGKKVYPRNAASPERIAIGPVVQISDGAVQTSDVSVKVKPHGENASAGGGTISYEEGIVAYLPTQAETNYTSFQLIAYKAGCIPASVTVVTSASATSGKVVLSGETHTSAVIPTVSTLTGHTAQTGDAYARLGAPAGASMSADIAGVKSDTAAILVDTGTDGVVVAAGSKTGYFLHSDYDAAKTAATQSSVDTIDGIVDAILEDTGTTLPATLTTIVAYVDCLPATWVVPPAGSDWTPTRAGYQDKLNVSGTLAHSDAAATYKADVSDMATLTALSALATYGDNH